MRKKIAIFTTKQGHKSIAEAIESALDKEYQVVTFYYVDFVFKGYELIYKHAPMMFSVPFNLSSNQRLLPPLKEYNRQNYQGKLDNFVEKHQPDLLINAFWMYEGALETISKEKQIPLINVLTDPRTFHPAIIAESPFLNLGFDDGAKAECLKYFPDANYLNIGWFTRDAFEKPYDKKLAKKNLNVNLEELTFLFVTGSDGTENVCKIIENLQPSQPLQILVACGKNQKLINKIQDLAEKVSPQITLLPFGFTTEIEKYMQAADLIIGKAGPNMLLEAVATLTPFFATTHIAGQEDGNLEVIEDYKLGYVEENPEKAVSLLEKIIAKPEVLKEFAPHLKSLADYNKNSKVKLQQLVKQIFKHPEQYLAPQE